MYPNEAPEPATLSVSHDRINGAHIVSGVKSRTRQPPSAFYAEQMEYSLHRRNVLYLTVHGSLLNHQLASPFVINWRWEEEDCIGLYVGENYFRMRVLTNPATAFCVCLLACKNHNCKICGPRHAVVKREKLCIYVLLVACFICTNAARVLLCLWYLGEPHTSVSCSFINSPEAFHYHNHWLHQTSPAALVCA